MESIPNAPLSQQAMDGHHNHHHQLEGLLLCPKNQQCQQQQPQLERKLSRPRPEPALKCPRCASTNTKFCYYNNYSLAQPRYFCKGCRRYWTQGGSLRNVPVGGGCRKNKRQTPHGSSSSSSFSSSSSKQQLKPQEQPAAAATANCAANIGNPFNLIPPAPLSSDLTLAFAGGHRNVPTAVGGLLASGINNGFLVDTTTVGNQIGGLSNLYFGFGGAAGAGAGDSGTAAAAGVLYFEGGGGGGGGDAGAAAVAMRTTVNNEMGSSSCNKDMEEGETKVLMGLPWQMGGGVSGSSGEGNMSSVDSGRDWTSGTGSSSWHGLINSSFISGARMDMTTSLGDAYAFF